MSRWNERSSEVAKHVAKTRSLTLKADPHPADSYDRAEERGYTNDLYGLGPCPHLGSLRRNRTFYLTALAQYLQLVVADQSPGALDDLFVSDRDGLTVWSLKEGRQVMTVAEWLKSGQAMVRDFALITDVGLPAGPEVDQVILDVWPQYDPVRAYLSKVSSAHGNEPWDGWDTLAYDWLGTDDPFHQALLTRWLISAVARVYKPGCQADGALVLQGGQGLGKSSFFRILGGQFQKDLSESVKDADRDRLLKQSWLLHLDELESVTRKKDVAAIKSFITQTEDNIRTLYRNEITTYPRRVVLCGSTNETEILRDSTGNRRFWVVPMTKHLDQSALASVRDRIWAEAVRRYHAGESWHLNPADLTVMAEHDQQYRVESVFADQLDDLSGISPADCCKPGDAEADCIAIHNDDLYEYLGVKGPDGRKKHRSEIESELRRLGWVSKVKKADGKTHRLWVLGNGRPHVLKLSQSGTLV